MKEIIKHIIVKDGVENIGDEAFKEFPPEQEWHKGKIDNLLKEDIHLEMNKNILCYGYYSRYILRDVSWIL